MTSRWTQTTNDGRYVYCIVDSAQAVKLGNIGLYGKPASLICHKDIGAVTSPIAYVEMKPDIDGIMSHQRVVEASRKLGTTLPVKFGVIFRNEDGVKTLLQKQYEDYRGKLTKLAGTDEFGVKILFNKKGMSKTRKNIEETSPEIIKMQRSLEKSGEGKSYFMKIKLNEAVRNEAYRRLDELSRKIHRELVELALQSSILKSDHEQILLNGAYLVRREEGEKFLERAVRLGKAYEDSGLIVHSSGPWAPYSFC